MSNSISFPAPLLVSPCERLKVIARTELITSAAGWSAPSTLRSLTVATIGADAANPVQLDDGNGSVTLLEFDAELSWSVDDSSDIVLVFGSVKAGGTARALIVWTEK